MKIMVIIYNNKTNNRFNKDQKYHNFHQDVLRLNKKC